MIVKFFNQGKGQGGPIINYLFDEKRHEGYKPELIKGNAFLTQSIIDSTTRKNKYTAGVISFRENEIISEEQQLKLINDFERTFAPFRENGRINYLWVRHFDKGRLELHFITPMTDLKSNLSFNISPPGKINQDFYSKWISTKNYEFGFSQVQKDKKVNLKEYKELKTGVDNFVIKRIDFIVSRFDKPKKIHNLKRKGLKNGNIRINSKSVKSSYGSFISIGEFSFKSIAKIKLSRASKSISERVADSGTSPNIRLTKTSQSIEKANRPNTNGGEFGNGGLKKESSNLSQAKSFPKVVYGSIDNQIYALSLSLSTCQPIEMGQILEQLGRLQAQKIEQGAQAQEHSRLNRPKFK